MNLRSIARTHGASSPVVFVHGLWRLPSTGTAGKMFEDHASQLDARVA